MNELVIVGAGDHARVALETARALEIPVRAVVEPRNGPAKTVDGVAVLSDLRAAASPDVRFIVAIGSNRARASVYETILGLGGRAASLVHPRAVLLTGATVGMGSHVCAGAVLGVDARVGDNVIVNTSASLDHDSIVGAHAFIGPGAILAGRVAVGEGAHVGLGALVVEGRKIGAWALVAAGATVIRDVQDGLRVAGVPAREMRSENLDVQA